MNFIYQCIWRTELIHSVGFHINFFGIIIALGLLFANLYKNLSQDSGWLFLVLEYCDLSTRSTVAHVSKRHNKILTTEASFRWRLERLHIEFGIYFSNLSFDYGILTWWGVFQLKSMICMTRGTCFKIYQHFITWRVLIWWNEPGILMTTHIYFT